MGRGTRQGHVVQPDGTTRVHLDRRSERQGRIEGQAWKVSPRILAIPCYDWENRLTVPPFDGLSQIPRLVSHRQQPLRSILGSTLGPTPPVKSARVGVGVETVAMPVLVDRTDKRD